MIDPTGGIFGDGGVINRGAIEASLADAQLSIANSRTGATGGASNASVQGSIAQADTLVGKIGAAIGSWALESGLSTL